jgi:hypothetical protein
VAALPSDVAICTDPVLGDAEIAEVGALLADRARCRVLMALIDGRALETHGRHPAEYFHITWD